MSITDESDAHFFNYPKPLLVFEKPKSYHFFSKSYQQFKLFRGKWLECCHSFIQRTRTCNIFLKEVFRLNSEKFANVYTVSFFGHRELSDVWVDLYQSYIVVSNLTKKSKSVTKIKLFPWFFRQSMIYFNVNTLNRNVTLYLMKVSWLKMTLCRQPLYINV